MHIPKARYELELVSPVIAVVAVQETGQKTEHALEDTIQSQNLYESPAFRVSREGFNELLAEVKRVDALITNKPPGHPVSGTTDVFAQIILFMPAHLSRLSGLFLTIA